MKLLLRYNPGLLFGIEFFTHMFVIELGFFGIVFNWQSHYCLECNIYRPKNTRKDEFYCAICLPASEAFQPLE